MNKEERVPKLQVNKDGSRKKPIKHFDSHNYGIEVGNLTRQAENLSKLIKMLTISKGDLTPMHKPSPQLLEDAKQKFTVYYTNEEYTDVLSLIQIQKQYSELSYATRMTTGVNREGKLVSPLVNNFKLNNN